MPCWYWGKKDLENSPSRQTGVSSENEQRYRREGAKFIYKLGQEMKLHHDTLASAAVFYHRFYQIHSFQKFRQRYVTATCCLFLAGKVEETPKKCKDLIKGAKQILSEQQFTQFGSDGQAREEVMAMERVLLQTIKFDFNIEHPYKYIIQYAEQLRKDLTDQIEDKKIEEMVQQSWNFTNDSMFTNLCLQWEPQIIAICMIYLAGKIQKIELLGYKTFWWEKFVPDLERDLIEAVCHQVLDIYSKPKAKTVATPAKTPSKRAKMESSPNDVTPAKKAKNSTVEKELQKLLSNVPEDQLREVMNKTEGTPSKVDPPLNTGQLPATPVSNVQNNFNYPAQMTTHSNPNTPMNQRTQRIQNQPKFSTPQPGRPNHQQNWHQNQQMYHPPGGGGGPPGHGGGGGPGYGHQQQQPPQSAANPWPDNNTPTHGGRFNNYHRQNTYPQRGGHGGGGNYKHNGQGKW